MCSGGLLPFGILFEISVCLYVWGSSEAFGIMLELLGVLMRVSDIVIEVQLSHWVLHVPSCCHLILLYQLFSTVPLR